MDCVGEPCMATIINEFLVKLVEQAILLQMPPSSNAALRPFPSRFYTKR